MLRVYLEGNSRFELPPSPHADVHVPKSCYWLPYRVELAESYAPISLQSYLPELITSHILHLMWPEITCVILILCTALTSWEATHSNYLDYLLLIAQEITSLDDVTRDLPVIILILLDVRYIVNPELCTARFSAIILWCIMISFTSNSQVTPSKDVSWEALKSIILRSLFTFSCLHFIPR